MTWERSGSFRGSWEDDDGYWAGRQILKSLEKRHVGQLADLLVVEEDGWDTAKTKHYREKGKHVIAAVDVYKFITEKYPEILL
jgi:hypothetical protein